MKAYLLGGAAFLAAAIEAATLPVDPIVVQGKHFFWKTNQTEFFVRGVAYQQDETDSADTGSSGTTAADPPDPLADVTACERDIPYLIKLRTNLVRTYSVNPSNDHSGCMNAFAAAGIYVISDLSTPSNSIDRDDPQWNVDLYQHYTALIQDLSQYTNTLGFFAGNEVSNSDNTTAASAFVRAAVRDSKAYIASNVDRPMYVGYATYDGPIRDQLAEYFNCGDQTSAIDFWGYNVYSWCGYSNYVTSMYQARTEFLEDFSIPAIFAEYGCNMANNVVITRPFTEVQALFGYNMTPVWSGGIAYQYFQTQNQYGLVNVSGNTVTTLQDYDNLSSQMAIASPSTTSFSAINTGTPFACPSVNATWQAVATPLPPTPNADLCDCVSSGVSCAVKNSTDADGYGDLFNFVCAQNNGAYCEGILANGTTGTYGAYSGCEPEQQLDLVLNSYYFAQLGGVNSASACDFGGSASLQSSTFTGSCAALISSAKTGGTTGSTNPSSTTTSATGSSKNAAPATRSIAVEHGHLYLVLYLIGAFATGAAALIL